MKAEIKRQWVEALRSGEYKQGKNYLATLNGAYCCLGVLCELANKWGATHRKKDALSHAYVYGDFGDDSSREHLNAYVLPRDVKAWAELDRSDPNITYKDETRPISEFNDSDMSFAEIADLIEEQL